MEISEIVKIITGTASKRDGQVRIGPSEVGGCRARVWHRLSGTPQTNFQVRKLAAFMGTAIHHAIEAKFDRIDPFQDRWLREHEVEYNGLMGHVDLYDKATKQIVDWKTITKKKIPYFPSQQQRTQVQLYGWLMVNNGFEVNEVSLVGICRDGDEDDIVVHTEPYHEETALAGLAWLNAVQEFVDDGVEIGPENKVAFCSKYCQFWDESGEVGCPGLPEEPRWTVRETRW